MCGMKGAKFDSMRGLLCRTPAEQRVTLCFCADIMQGWTESSKYKIGISTRSVDETEANVVMIKRIIARRNSGRG